MSRATHFVGTADLPQSKRTRWAGGRRFRVGRLADISQLRQKESPPRGRPLDSAHNQAFNPYHNRQRA